MKICCPMPPSRLPIPWDDFRNGCPATWGLYPWANLVKSTNHPSCFFYPPEGPLDILFLPGGSTSWNATMTHPAITQSSPSLMPLIKSLILSNVNQRCQSSEKSPARGTYVGYTETSTHTLNPNTIWALSIQPYVSLNNRASLVPQTVLSHH